jgi:SSS family transporter
MFGMPLWLSIVVVGIITLVYSTSGGMKAVVYGDVIQMILIFVGLVLVAWFGIAELGGLDAFWQSVDAQRLQVIRLDSLGMSGDEFGFVPMILGGFVLYASYYGCDQTQAQRAMSAKSTLDVKKLLFANGIFRFPIVLLYCLTGLIIGVVVKANPELLAQVPADKPDYMMPVFILSHMPNGVIGLLLIAILSAAMSSLSSTVNSLAAVTLEDLNALKVIDSSQADKNVLHARYISLFWGVVILVLSFFAGSIAPTVIEAINKVGSALYGPILGVFLLVFIPTRTRAAHVNVGLIVGMLFNLYLWVFQAQVFWMWWNFIGLIVTVSIAYLLSVFAGGESKTSTHLRLNTSDIQGIRFFGGWLIISFLSIVAISYLISFFSLQQVQ